MISLKNVNKYFNRHKKNEMHVINDTSLELGDCGLVALLGPSGSGKTTLLNAIGGLDKIDSGTISIASSKMPKGQNYRKDKMRVLNIGYIFQNYNLLDNLSVYENVALSLKMIGIKNKKVIKERTDYILELVGMYRFKHKLAGNLSGGQRQRVGIARAVAKNPRIIIADEPTGNLDSKNTIEIMNIIKKISESRLVILVTHEAKLAHFYASRIITLEDGVVTSDKENDHEEDLDYRIDNKIYLKDFKAHETLKKETQEINIYSDAPEKIKIDLVVKNGNIFIKSHGNEKIEVVDDESAIELLDEHYKKIGRQDYEDKKYDLSKFSNDKLHLKYSSIYNVYTMFKQGFNKIRDYSLMKKLLLAGFFFSAMFTMYALSSIFGAITIEDEDFLNAHRDYIAIENKENNVEDFKKIEALTDIAYVIPGTSEIKGNIKNPLIWQLDGQSSEISASLAGLSVLDESTITTGRAPNSTHELVVDELVIKSALKNDPFINMLAIHEASDFVGKKMDIGESEYTIVGISSSANPCIYARDDELIDIIGGSNPSQSDYTLDSVVYTHTISSYDALADKITIKTGRIPKNDYETLVREDENYGIALNSELEYKINSHKLKVVGTYTSESSDFGYVVSSNTYKYATILQNRNMLLVSRDKEASLKKLKALGFNAVDNYDILKNNHIQKIKENIVESLILSGILLAISFIEITLIIRASFLSRIKEVGILRAIGVKKSDIYKMFLGEILIITTIAGVPGVILMSSILKEFSKFPFFSSLFVINRGVVLLGMLIIYALNVLVGLWPIRALISKTPAQILARNDVD